MSDRVGIELPVDRTAEYWLTGQDSSPGPREDTRVVIGGRDSKTNARFVPQVAFERWFDESGQDYFAWLSINHPDKVTAEKETFADGKITQTLGDNRHEIYEKDDGIVAHDVVMAKAWGASFVTFDYKRADGVELYIQPPLSQAEIDEGHYRPVEVEWSIAVYCDRANGRFKTGKLAHIYRPKWIDAKGDVSWGWWEIDEDNSQIIAHADSSWLKDATYPVRLDPDMGYTTMGASSLFGGVNRTFAYLRNSSMTEDGTLDSVSIGSGLTGTYDFTLELHDRTGAVSCSSGGSQTFSKEVTSQSFTSGSWVTHTAADEALTSGDFYAVLSSIDTASIFYIRYDTGGVVNPNYCFSSAYQADWTTTGFSTSSNTTRLVSQYYSYSDSGGTSYTPSISTGDISFSGSLTGPGKGSEPSVSAGSIAFSGSLTGPGKGSEPSIDAGSITFSSDGSTVSKGVAPPVDAGAATFSGTLDGPGKGTEPSVSTGAMAFSGSLTGPGKGSEPSVDAGLITFSSPNAKMVKGLAPPTGTGAIVFSGELIMSSESGTPTGYAEDDGRSSRPPGRYVAGDFWLECDECGFAYRLSELTRRWDGALVCRKDWDPPHPRDKRVRVPRGERARRY